MSKKQKLLKLGALGFIGTQLLTGCMAGGGSGGMLAAMPQVNGKSSLNKCSSSGSVQTAGNFDIGNLEGDHLEVGFQYLVARGMTAEGAAGIIASVKVESAGGFPWMAEHGGGFSIGKGWGIIQWTADRHQKIKDAVIAELGEKYYTSQYSNPPAAEWMSEEDVSKLMQFQLKYLWDEMQDPYYKGNTFDPIMKATDPGEAAAIFVRNFERPADIPGQSAQRAVLAQEIYEKMKHLADKTDKQKLVETADTKELKWAYPFEGTAKMTSPFGNRPQVGVDGSTIFHGGIDLVPNGGNKDVRSISSGTVTRASFDDKSGNMVVIRLDNGDYTRMAHLESMAVKVGDKVEAGQKIGVMGSTGYSTGAHLHFETLVGDDITAPNDWGTANPNQNKTNPVDYLASKGFNVDGTENGQAPSDSIVKGTTGGGTEKALNKSCSGSQNTSNSGGGGGVVASGKNMNPRSDLPGFDPKDVENQEIKVRHDNETDYVARIGNYFVEKHGEDLGIEKATDYASGPPSCHANGEALDLWVNSEENFDTTAAWLIKHADAMQISLIIWKQQIWINNPTQNSWAMMEDRGSPTQNHLDHIHVSFAPCIG